MRNLFLVVICWLLSLALFAGYGAQSDGKPDQTRRTKFVAAQAKLEPILPTGHSMAAITVALSVNGKLVVTGSADHAAILWEAASGRKLTIFYGHTRGVLSAALSADGKQLVTGSADKTAIFWDAATGKKLESFLGHTKSVSCVALSADGRQVITGSYDNTAILWETATGKKLGSFLGHTNSVSSVALSTGRLVDAKQSFADVHFQTEFANESEENTAAIRRSRRGAANGHGHGPAFFLLDLQ